MKVEQLRTELATVFTQLKAEIKPVEAAKRQHRQEK